MRLGEVSKPAEASNTNSSCCIQKDNSILGDPFHRLQVEPKYTLCNKV